MILDTNKLCKPSQYYFMLSVLGLLLSIAVNAFTSLNCSIKDNSIAFIAQFTYILFWSWFLNKLCVKGYKKVSWALFFSPIIVTTFLISVIFLNV